MSDDDPFEVSREEAYENARLVRKIRKLFPDDDISSMADIIDAYRTGKKIFIVLFWAAVFAGIAALFIFKR